MMSQLKRFKWKSEMCHTTTGFHSFIHSLSRGVVEYLRWSSRWAVGLFCSDARILNPSDGVSLADSFLPAHHTVLQAETNIHISSSVHCQQTFSPRPHRLFRRFICIRFKKKKNSSPAVLKRENIKHVDNGIKVALLRWCNCIHTGTCGQ